MVWRKEYYDFFGRLVGYGIYQASSVRQVNNSSFAHLIEEDMGSKMMKGPRFCGI